MIEKNKQTKKKHDKCENFFYDPIEQGMCNLKNFVQYPWCYQPHFHFSLSMNIFVNT